MKKIFIITLVTTLVITLIYGAYQSFQNNEPEQTGASRIDIAPPEYYTELNAIEKLNSELPLIVGGITITFDYSKGKYIVTSEPGIDTESEFLSWYATESYKLISRDRFLVK